MSKSVYEMVTDRIINQLEQGVIPWQKPWTGVRSGAYNRISKKSYSLLNQMLLQHDGEYATFKQWQDLGGHVRKGEKSEIVTFWKIQPVEEEQEDGTKVVKQIPLLRYFNVFHISQVDGVEPLPKEKSFDIRCAFFGYRRHERHISTFLIAFLIHDEVISHNTFRIAVIRIHKAFADRRFCNFFFHLCRKRI